MGVNKLFIANWKMELTYEQQISLAHQYVTELKDINKPIVLCPSYESIEAVQKVITSSTLKLGAQGCSPHGLGPYTGQVAADSLAQLGCHYTLIGHSEWRKYTHEASDRVVKQYKQLSRVGITPIVCIGDEDIAQLNTLIPLASQTLHIAYEPSWAIGSGKPAKTSELHKIHALITSYIPSTLQFIFLYGGSVNPATVKELHIPEVDGFLVGSASLDVQKLKKIVSYS